MISAAGAGARPVRQDETAAIARDASATQVGGRDGDCSEQRPGVRLIAAPPSAATRDGVRGLHRLGDDARRSCSSVAEVDLSRSRAPKPSSVRWAS